MIYSLNLDIIRIFDFKDQYLNNNNDNHRIELPVHVDGKNEPYEWMYDDWRRYLK